jgi:hypothetical protein
MGLLRFLRQHLWLSFGLLGFTALQAFGLASDAYDLYQMGIPGWVWQLIGVAFLTIALTIFAYRLKAELLASLPVERSDPSSTVAPTPPPPPPAEKPSQADLIRRERNSTLIRIDRARKSARTAAVTGYDQPSALADLKSTLTILQKLYDLNTPSIANERQPTRCLDAGKRYLDVIYPYVRDGHIDEARECAEQMVPKLDEYVDKGIRDIL